MSLQDEKYAALAEILAVTGESVVWQGQTYQALVTDNLLSLELALGGFVAKGDCTIKIPRTALNETENRRSDPISGNGLPHHTRYRSPNIFISKSPSPSPVAGFFISTHNHNERKNT